MHSAFAIFAVGYRINTMEYYKFNTYKFIRRYYNIPVRVRLQWCIVRERTKDGVEFRLGVALVGTWLCAGFSHVSSAVLWSVPMNSPKGTWKVACMFTGRRIFFFPFQNLSLTYRTYIFLRGTTGIWRKLLCSELFRGTVD